MKVGIVDAPLMGDLRRVDFGDYVTMTNAQTRRKIWTPHEVTMKQLHKCDAAVTRSVHAAVMIVGVGVGVGVSVGQWPVVGTFPRVVRSRPAYDLSRAVR